MTSCPLDNAARAALAADCLRIAELGSVVALAGFRTRTVAREKSAHDLVTEFDVATQAKLLELIAERHPGVPVAAEEGGEPGAELPPGLSFAVDPIDGTTNFAHGHPFWAVSVGVLYDGEPLGGAIVAPCLSLKWQGHREDDGGVVLRNGVPCRVSDTAVLESSLLATGFPPNRSENPDSNFASFVAVKRRAQAVRRCGAAAIDIAFVADGTYDGYWERRLHIWDAAAAAAMVLAAGGRITALDGGLPRYERGHLIVTNGRIHEELRHAIRANPGPITF